jgi:plastocyanin
MDRLSTNPHLLSLRQGMVIAVLAVTIAAGALWFMISGGIERSGDQPAPAVPASEATGVFHAPAMVFQSRAGLVVTIPEGTAESISRDGHLFELPPSLHLTVGQSVSVRNEDRLTHVVLGMAVPPGETRTRTLENPGYEVYSGGCAAHARGSGMTTLIIASATEPDAN